METMEKHGEMVVYQSRDGHIELGVKLENNDVWITQMQMSKLFNKDVKTINEHLKTLYKEKEIEENRTIRKFQIVQKEGSRDVEREVSFYNLDAIVSVGYRVNSKEGTQFRI